MKHFYFLSNLCKTITRSCSVVAILLTIGVGNVWGTTTTITTTSGTSWTVDGRTWTAATDVANVSGSSPYLAMKSNSSNITVNSTMSMDLSGSKTVTVTVGAGSYGGNQASVTAKLVNSSGTTISNVGSATPSTNGNKSYTITLTPTDRTVTDAKVIIGVSSATANTKYIRLYSFAVTYTGKPLITLSKTSITGLNYDYGSGPSASQTFTVTGVELGANITVTAPTNFEVSTSSGSGYGSSVTLTRSGTSVSTTTIYVRLAAGKAVGSYGGASTYVTATSTNATTKNVSVSGTVASVASCDANPTIGNASLNGSFKLTSLTDAVSVSSGTCSPGSDCAWTDYGFVWSLGSTTTTPTVSNNKVQVGTSGTATSWATDASHKVQPSSGTTPTSWAVGSTYYVRTYGKNGKDAAEFNYGTAASFTLRSITFNSNGGSSVGPWYVNSGGTYSAPTAPTKTGYTFGGWYTDNSTFESAVDWTASVSENKTFYAKWTASVYRISLDNESPTTSGSTYVDLTYNSSTHAGIINPKKTGYTFGGYWTADNGTGTMVINTSGVLQANVTNYTGAGGIWTKAATTTLYAKWTINNYTVTWKVNGEEWSGKGGTDNANYNTAWSSLTLPTAPDPDDDGCGHKFVGWTTTENYSNATTAPTDLLNADNKSGKTAVKITDDVVFYAVFADYDE